METTVSKKIRRQRKRPILDLAAHIIETIRTDGPMSRVELARKIGVGAATTGNYAEKMIEAGLLYERSDSAKVYSGKGRPPTLVDLNTEGGALVGIDVEGPVLRVIRFDFCLNAKMERVETISPELEFASLKRIIVKAVQAVRPDPSENWLGIGLAFPGPVAEDEPGFFPGVERTKLADALAARFGVPVHADNDMCCMAYGERMKGAGRYQDYFLALAARAGWVGAAVFGSGELTAGPQRGLEINRWLLPVSGDLDLPQPDDVSESGQKRYQLSRLASVTGLLVIHEAVRARRGGKGEALNNFDEFCERLEAGDPLTVEAAEVTAEAVGRVIARIDDIMNFEEIVLDGLFVDMGDAFLGAVNRHCHRFSMRREPRQSDKIVYTGLGESAGALGAAALCLKFWEYSEV